MRTLFDVGQADPRETARCEVQPYMLLGFAGILVAVIGIKVRSASGMLELKFNGFVVLGRAAIWYKTPARKARQIRYLSSAVLQ